MIPLRLLLVEDQEHDAALLLSELGRLGYDVTWERVETRAEMVAALAERQWDLIISDFSLPQFDAQGALSVYRERAVKIPFIIVSGTIDEEQAVESMRQGAHDFITKGRLARLGPAIERGLREFEERRARQAAEGRLRQAQKMEAIGQLAGGVAHDFNNLLGVILGYGELLLRELAPGDHRRKRLDQMLGAATRGATLTRQLLTFSRQQPLQSRPVDMNTVVAEIEPMLRRLISEDIQIVTVLSEGLHVIRADPAQIEQVLMNLAINARDAMSEGGRLIIETGDVDLDESYVKAHPDARPGAHAMLAVSDTGCGMDSSTLSHVFEPFFTTKPPGKGTGLGLSTVYGIVRQSDGHISVYSEPGKGTTFKVYFPRSDEMPALASVPESSELARIASETVLLVEDDPTLRAVIRDLLEEGGYTVIDGITPEASLAVAQEHAGPIHLLLTDLVMPRIGGREVAERIQAVRPEVRVLYMSGYTGAAAEYQGSLPDGHAFVQKPFSLDTLLRKVRAVLDSPQ